jgi:ribosomal protein S18 acetylase RimI-like enzyme
MCSIETIFKKNDFDDKKDNYIYGKNINYDYNNTVKKSYYDDYRYIIYLNGFEIEKEFREMGYGNRSMKLILRDINKKFPKNDGIYLSVLKENISAVKIYKKFGFNIIQEIMKSGDDIYVMKYSLPKK